MRKRRRRGWMGGVGCGRGMSRLCLGEEGDFALGVLMG
jgi:hypothetical protein